MDRRRATRRQELERNLERMRSNGRMKVGEKPSSSGRLQPVKKARSNPKTTRVASVGASTAKMKAIGKTTSRLKPVKATKPPKRPAKKPPRVPTNSSAPEPTAVEVDPFQALLPATAPAAIDDLKQQVANLTRLQEVIHFLNGAPDSFTLRRELLDLALSVSELPRGMLALRCSDDSSDRATKFKVVETRGFYSDDRRTPETKVLRRIMNRTLETGEPLLEGDIREQGIMGFASRKAKKLKLGAVVCLPLAAAQGQTLGALILDDPTRNQPFSTAEESLLRSFARHASQALRRVRDRSRFKRRIQRVQRRNERLEAENQALEQQALDAQAAQHEEAKRQAPTDRAGRQMRKLLGMPYADGKRKFTRYYLLSVMTQANGDLRIAAQLADLPVARLVGLLEHLDVSRSNLGPVSSSDG